MPTLLALKQAGLEYLLFDEAHAHAIRDAMQAAARQPESRDVRAPVRHTSPAARTPQNPVQDMREKSDSQAISRLGAHSSNTTPDPALWPAAWQERLEKTRSAQVIWTYWELGRDVCGAPDPHRRELLKELLQGLAHPPGTHSFWPLALPASDEEGEQELTANAPVFWEGVRLLHSRAVVVMGSQARDSLALPDSMRELRPFRQVRYQGRQLILLHSPDILIQEPQRIQALQEFLRQALAPFAVH